MNKQKALAVAICAVTSVGLAGCFGGSSSSSSTDSSTENGEVDTSNVMTSTSDLEGEQQGTLQDAAVQGLQYWTASAGLQKTDESGRFDFEPGEIVAFYLGGNRLMVTDAETISTPMDVTALRRMSKESNITGHPHESVNLMRLLQTIDQQPDNDDVIEVPDTFGNQTDDELQLALDTEDFAGSQDVADILTEADRQGSELTSYADASAHLAETLSNLDNNDIDLRGTWHTSGGRLSSFGAEFVEGCELQELAVMMIDDNGVFLSGDELNTQEGESGEECVKETYEADNEPDGIEAETRDGMDGIAWTFDDFGLIDLECGPLCDLGELRSTVNDWDAACLSNDYDYDQQFFDFGDDVDFCDESDDHNGPIVGFSEVTFTDRLGGDRVIRIKRDFSASEAPEEGAERADDFTEQGFFVESWDREETRDHTVDLSEGQWNEALIANEDADTVHDREVSLVEGQDGFAPEYAPECTDYPVCRWDELNSSGNGVDWVYVRGTGVINWIEGDTVGTLTRAD